MDFICFYMVFIVFIGMDEGAARVPEARRRPASEGVDTHRLVHRATHEELGVRGEGHGVDPIRGVGQVVLEPWREGVDLGRFPLTGRLENISSWRGTDTF